MNKYKVIVRKSPGWKAFNTATLGISVESPNWQDDKFESILTWASNHFDTIRIDVSDALYRHNFMAEGVLPEDALSRANALGALWLTKHSDIISSCSVKPQIVRWGEWYKHKDYDITLAAFAELSQTSVVFSRAINADVESYFQRADIIPTLKQISFAKSFLIEEVAVITLQARELASLKVYPGEDLNCMKVVRCGLVEGAPKGLEREQHAKIKFGSRSSTHNLHSSGLNERLHAVT